MPEKILFEDVVADPERFFADPAAVLDDARFSRAQKRRILENWAEDALALMRAEAENMEAKRGEPAAGTLLKRIEEAQRLLE